MRRAALLLASVVAAASLSGCLQGRLVGEPVPPFELVTSEGERVNASTYLGRWLVLDLMATWCGPCKLEVDHLREVKRLHGDKVVILSVGADPTETTADLERFAREHGAEWPYALDYDGKVGRAMGMRIIPKLVVVDPQGRVALEREGEVLPAAISAVIDPTVAPPGGGAGLLAPALLAFALGLLAPFNPHRRFHRASPRAWPTFAGVAAAGALLLLAWPFAGLVSTRATYGSLLVGALSLVAVGWWFRLKATRDPPAHAPNAALEAGDRLYEWSPHLALTLVLGLLAGTTLGYFAPALAFVGGAALGAHASAGRVPERAADVAGLAGLALAGVGLLAFGARILVA